MTLSASIAKFYGQGKEQRNGAGYLTLCPVHGNVNTPALAVKDTGDQDVDVYCHAGCDWKDIKDRFRQDGLLPEWKPKRMQTATSTRKTRKKEQQSPPVTATSPASSSDGQAGKDTEEPEKESLIWKRASKDNLDHARKYFAGRAITIDLPVCIRWHSYTDRKTSEPTHIIVAAASKPADTAVYAVQRLFIDIETHRKTGAKMFGPCEGRGIWFNRKGDHSEILIGEGIETVLSAMQATGKNGVAALSTSGMKALEIPEATETIYILVDSDPVRDNEAASMPGQKAAYITAQQFTASRPGRQAFLISPDDTCFSSSPNKIDFNDLLKADSSGATIRARFDAAIPIEQLQWQPPAPRDQDDTGYYPPDTLDALHALNKIYAGVVMGGDFRVVKEGFDEHHKKHTLSFLKITALYNLLANTKGRVAVGPEKGYELRPLAKLWMEWDQRRTYEDIVFDPSNTSGPRVYNLFRGFPVEPKQGDWSKLRQHMLEVLCNDNQEHFTYLMCWMARMVQDPGGSRPGVAVVLKGGKGVGKGVFVNYFGEIFGEAFLPISDSESFTGRFNMHLSKSLLVFLDEAVWGGDKKAEGKMKQLITEPRVLFEPKGIDTMALDNHISVMIASNEDWVIPATGDERRFFVLNPNDKYCQNHAYFRAIIKEKKEGGVAALMYDLLRWDYRQVELRKAPKTEGLIEQVQESLPSVLEFWLSTLSRGFLLSDEQGKPRRTEMIFGPDETLWLWPVEVFKHEVFFEYTQWCRRQNERYVKTEQQFWTSTWKFWPGGKKRNRKRSEAAASGYVEAFYMPTLQDVRDAFTAHTNIEFHELESDQKPFNDEF